MGACLSGRSLKSWDPRCGVQTLYSSGRSWELYVPSQLWVAMLGVGIYGLHLSLSCHVSVDFSVRLMCRSHSASFWIAFRGSCPVCGRRLSVSVGGGSSGSYVTRRLDPKPLSSLLTLAFELLAFIVSSKFLSRPGFL